jgi:hypothetical protein
MSGEPIAHAKVSVGVGDVGSSTTTDAKGRWGFLSDTTDSGWIEIEAKGFRSERFEYYTTGKSSQVCKKPVYIRLIVGADSCPVVTMNAKHGIKK